MEPSGYGYISLTSCGNSPEQSWEIYNQFTNIITDFISKNVSGFVFDLRINAGGQDNFAAAISSFFIMIRPYTKK